VDSVLDITGLEFLFAMDAMKKGWFSEIGNMWPGMAQSLEVEKILHEEKSEFQDIKVLQT
jgi:spermidine synthase